MQIGSSHTLSHLVSARQAAAPSQISPAISTSPSDSYRPEGLLTPLANLGVAARLLGLGQLYRLKSKKVAETNAKNSPLSNVAPVTLEQPFVLIPGWTTTKKAFAPLVDKLVEGGRNGGQVVFVSQGEFYQDRALQNHVDIKTAPTQDNKVFEVVFSDSRVPPHVAAQELKKNFAVIKELTGEERLDVSAYSMGGLATRVYLDEGGQDIDQLMTVGTPHRGSEFAHLAREALRRDIGWAVSIAGLLPADLPALEWLAPLDRKGENPRLEALNERWPGQKALVNEVRIVGGKGTISADDGWKRFTDGDGLVAADSVSPPGETPVIIPNQHHSHLNNDPAVFHQMKDFFHWQASA